MNLPENMTSAWLFLFREPLMNEKARIVKVLASTD